ncbi:vWA domain-containing protein [Marinobacter persicus]|uniref:Metal-dependent peptidase n=1 Tax=Marinobacter persicus TaxID=930118 RepID=A0A2S6G6T7_9GAMM|nr:VWA-like domain-containing protein [Marinobacter persicus]PPK51605.1 putative metal-dependent peptidase [Marinobacter persicus]PPK54825.1 putative metal-dependent peptidase [Marinobacter persicus]PPK58543.1 putative metal-dependent peptidase [Marinobacter persicus]
MTAPQYAMAFDPSEDDQALKQCMRKTLEDDRAILMTAQPFTAMLAMQLNLIPVVDSRLPTAGTDGKNVFFNARFMADRSRADRRFVLAHEVWHCALGHFRRQLGRDSALWNQACDYEVNHLLSDELGHCPKDALWDRRFQSLSAEEVYARLCHGIEQARKGQQVLDTHDLEQALKEQSENLVIDPDFAPETPATSQEEQALSEAWRQRLLGVAQQRERMPGNLPGHLRRIIGGIREPQVPWQQLLARFLKKQQGGDRQWLPPSRRHIHRGLYLPSRRGNLLELTVALDNSGSCLDDIPAFLGELKGMLAAFNRVNLRLMIFDTCIQSDLQLTEQDLYQLDKMELKGGGGTNFRPVFAACNEQPPQALIVLTDGCAEAPEHPPTYPVLWALTKDGKRPVNWGNALNLTDHTV